MATPATGAVSACLAHPRTRPVQPPDSQSGRDFSGPSAAHNCEAKARHLVLVEAGCWTKRRAEFISDPLPNPPPGGHAKQAQVEGWGPPLPIREPPKLHQPQTW